VRLSGLLLAVAALVRPTGASAAAADTPATPAASAPPAAVAAPAPAPGRELDRPLGSLERESLAEALATLGLTIEPHPEGKRIRKIHAVSQDVFSKHDWLFQLFNVFHRTTRPLHLERELLVAPGQLYDQALVDESVRNLQSPPVITIANRTTVSPPDLSSVVVLVPVVSPEPGTVDILAVTRDLWSLRFNTNFEFQGSALSLLQSSLSENNLLGWRKYLALTFDMDLGRYGFGPSYIDPNIMGTRLLLVARATLWYARDTDRYEGDTEIVSLRYPLYSLASRWGAGLDVTHQDAVVRNFLGTSVRPVGVNTTAPQTAMLPGDTVVVPVPYKYRRRILTTDLNVLRSFRRGDVIQRLVFGHRFDRRRSLVTEDFPVDADHPDLARQFLDQQAPIDETRSEPYVRYEVFTARYATFRDLDTFDLRESHRLGPILQIEAGAGLPVLGADVVAFPVSALVGWSIGSANGAYGYVQVQGSARARGGGWIDETLDTQFLIASPPIARLARLILYAQTDTVRDDTHRTKFFIGGSTGLRGYAIGDFDGSSSFVAHVELRSLPLAIFSQRFGALLFYDAGDANRSFAELVPHHDTGVGLRWLIPQLNSAVLRIDWAVATQSGPQTRPGLPGRVTAGFMQVY
jgi:Omp85 superfamily domain